jgi:hypothetical protein
MHHGSNRSGKFKRPVIFRHYHLTTEVQDSAIRTILVPLNVLIAGPSPVSPAVAHLRAASPLANGGPFFVALIKKQCPFLSLADIVAVPNELSWGRTYHFRFNVRTALTNVHFRGVSRCSAFDSHDQGASKPFDFITANDVGDEINDAKAFAAWI